MPELPKPFWVVEPNPFEPPLLDPKPVDPKPFEPNPVDAPPKPMPLFVVGAAPNGDDCPLLCCVPNGDKWVVDAAEGWPNTFEACAEGAPKAGGWPNGLTAD